MKDAALDRLSGLIGTWALTMSNAWFLDSLDEKVRGQASFEWLDDTFVVFRWAVGDTTPPALSVIGYSDSRSQYVMLYHDDRGVARVFDMGFADGEWTLLRADSDFHQRFEAHVEDARIEGAWHASEDEGRTWRKDFDLLFERT
ncbi:MAG TPA: hypothetical protein VGA97_00650 [Acidimicrobiia bacterium]|jgi:hypothetical protein